MLEQSLIKTCKPYYNQDDTVNFVITSWNSNWLDSPRITNILSKPVEIRVNNEVILTVNSKLEASKVVGRDPAGRASSGWIKGAFGPPRS